MIRDNDQSELSRFRVLIMLEDRTWTSDVVEARTAADAGVILGDRMRADRGIEPGGYIGIESIDIRRLR